MPTGSAMTVGQGAVSTTCGKPNSAPKPAGYTRIRVSVNSAASAEVASLVDRIRLLQIHLLPFTLHDSLTNLGGGLSLLVHGVGVVGLFQANRTLGAVRALEAAMQTIVSHAAVAIAIARLLMQDAGNFGRQFVGVALKRILGVFAP